MNERQELRQFINENIELDDDTSEVSEEDIESLSDILDSNSSEEINIDEMKEEISNMTDEEYNEFMDSLSEEEIAEVEVAGLVRKGTQWVSKRDPRILKRAVKKGIRKIT